MSEILKITKLMAAERQLFEAIKLFFEEGDPISIHTLTSASLGILNPLCRQKKGFDGFIVTKKSPYIKEEKRKEWINFIRIPQNFFKHADNDPDNTLEFRPKINKYHIIEAVSLHEVLSEYIIIEFYIFKQWFLLSNPELITKEAQATYSDFIKKETFDSNDYSLWRELLNQGQRNIQRMNTQINGKPWKSIYNT